jgi:hypothetical protein
MPLQILLLNKRPAAVDFFKNLPASLQEHFRAQQAS